MLLAKIKELNLPSRDVMSRKIMDDKFTLWIVEGISILSGLLTCHTISDKIFETNFSFHAK